MAVKSTGAAPGQVVYAMAGTYNWTVPAGVTSISMVAVQPGGTSLGTTITYASVTVCRAQNGARIGDGGGDGGNGGKGGGGAGGYSGNGGNGGFTDEFGTVNPTAGTGGGGGGGTTVSGVFFYHTAGGGVGLLGQGANGAAGTFGDESTARGGKGGSGGGDGQGYPPGGGQPAYGGSFGGGGGMDYDGESTYTNRGGALSYKNNVAVTPGQVVTIVIPALGRRNNGGGGVRIIWGAGRAYPATNTGDK